MEAKSGASLHHLLIQAVRILFKAVGREFLHGSYLLCGSGYVDKADRHAAQESYAAWRRSQLWISSRGIRAVRQRTQGSSGPWPLVLLALNQVSSTPRFLALIQKAADLPDRASGF